MEEQVKRLRVKLNYLETHIDEYGMQWHKIIKDEISLIKQQLDIFEQIENLPTGEIAII